MANKAITIIKETDNEIIFNYHDKNYHADNCKVKKCGGWEMEDTRYIQLGEVMYDDIGFNITDGHAVSNGIYHTNKWSNPNGYCLGDEINIDENINDVVEFIFPTINEILSSKKLFEESLYYMYDLDISFDNFLEYLQKGLIDLTWFFEGFFFGGCSAKKFKILVNNTIID